MPSTQAVHRVLVVPVHPPVLFVLDGQGEHEVHARLVLGVQAVVSYVPVAHVEHVTHEAGT